ncbi:ATP-grasp domain-containing protein [Prosthecochloris sp. SCSIO W1103]|uniref:ATP-grasp domain-containing protein n=1 Tax=Prosthecochloris sp. SCSIO W1103 TaxID=2992244 RepID=UPI00223E3113|nr:ATP-grasp domain-containing protein [Prosthecochloris sp. SCSIO W1103]UZJ36923.1 ATP-grasp domain-containing protein [Prosthecochloris sp. SCSIO W1103]
MAHILMIESWVGGTARLLPPMIKKLGHEYSFVTRNPSHYGAQEGKDHPVVAGAKNTIVTETNDIDGLCEVLEGIHKREAFDAVLTICDYYITTVTRVADRLELPHPFPKNSTVARRKDQVRKALTQHGLANPGFDVVNSVEEALHAGNDLGYPLVIKPTDLASSAFVRMVHNGDELRESCRAIMEFETNFRDQKRDTACLIEEYMSGEEVSVEAITIDGKTTIIGVTDKSISGTPFFIEDGHMFPAQLDDTLAEEACELAESALEAIGFDNGISHTEIKLTERGPRIVEINPRPAGNYISELIEHVTGKSLVEAFVRLAIGEKPSMIYERNGAGSAAIKFLMPDQGGVVKSISGIETLENNAHVTRWHLDAKVGGHVNEPIDNGCYIGHLVAVDPNGGAARAIAENAAESLKIEVSTSEKEEVNE